MAKIFYELRIARLVLPVLVVSVVVGFLVLQQDDAAGILITE